MKAKIAFLITILTIVILSSCDKKNPFVPDTPIDVPDPQLLLDASDPEVFLGDSVTINVSSNADKTENNLSIPETGPNWTYTLKTTKVGELSISVTAILGDKSLTKTKTVLVKEIPEPTRTDTLTNVIWKNGWQIDSTKIYYNGNWIFLDLSQKELDNREVYYPNGDWKVFRYGIEIGGDHWEWVGKDSLRLAGGATVRYELTDSTFVAYGHGKMYGTIENSDSIISVPSVAYLHRDISSN